MRTINIVGSTVDPQIAFENAIAARYLSKDHNSPNYAGRFMFMGEDEAGNLLFKNRNTRSYIVAVNCA